MESENIWLKDDFLQMYGVRLTHLSNVILIGVTKALALFFSATVTVMRLK